MAARFDWFQTEDGVTITIPKKGIKVDDCQVQYDGQKVKVTVSGQTVFEESLARDFDANNAVLNTTRAMIELKLPKSSTGRWPSLIATKEEMKQMKQMSATKNWDKIEKEVLDDDDVEGDAAVNKMFKKLFEDGTDDVKKAMMKSYQESGGTVLSTNWEEIKKKRTEVKPPDCMEYKRFEQ